MFDISDFGPLSARLQEFADCKGQIPVSGDSWQDFSWPKHLHKLFANQENGEDNWQDFVNRANIAIQQAEEKLEALESSDEWYMGRSHRR